MNEGLGELRVSQTLFYTYIRVQNKEEVRRRDAVEAAGVRVERLELEGRPHGLGYTENWFDAFDNFLTAVFANE